MHIDLNGVKYIAKLACLELDEEELSTTLERLEAVLDLCDKLESYKEDLSDVPAHLTYLINSWDEDSVEKSLSRDDALKNSSNTRSGLFMVPKIID